LRLQSGGNPFTSILEGRIEGNVSWHHYKESVTMAIHWLVEVHISLVWTGIKLMEFVPLSFVRG
jgi:hypothetical protein